MMVLILKLINGNFLTVLREWVETMKELRSPAAENKNRITVAVHVNFVHL